MERCWILHDPVLAGLQTMDRTLIEAAKLDGAGRVAICDL